MVASPVGSISEQSPAPTHKWGVAAAVILGAMLQSLDVSIINVALPYMQKSFKSGVDQTTWVVTSYLVAVSIMIPLTGWLAERLGRKAYFFTSVVTFVVTSALCGQASGIGEMVLFRVLQGAAGAAMLPLSQAILLETFPPAEHTLAMTTFGLGVMVAPVFGPTLGGWLTMNWNWRWNFYINIPTGALAALMVYVFVHDPPYLRERRGRGRVDYLGIILVALGLGLGQIVLGRGGRAGWFAAVWVRYFTVISVSAIIALVIHELRFSEPVIDLRMLKVLGFSLAVFLISAQALILFSVNLLNPLFMETVLGYDAWRAGIAVAPRGLGVMVAMLLVGQLSRRGVDMRPVITAGFAMAAYEIWRMSHWNLSVGMSDLLWPIFIMGFGLGVVFPTVTALGVGQMPRERMGFAASLFSMMLNTGAAAGIAVFTNLLTASHRLFRVGLMEDYYLLDASRSLAVSPHVLGAPILGLPERFAAGAIGLQAWLSSFQTVYWVIAVVTLCLAPAAMLLKKTRGAGMSTDTIME